MRWTSCARAMRTCARRAMHAAFPRCRRRAPDFAGLAAIITGQQLSVSAARSIWARMEAGLGEVSVGNRFGGAR